MLADTKYTPESGACTSYMQEFVTMADQDKIQHTKDLATVERATSRIKQMNVGDICSPASIVMGGLPLLQTLIIGQRPTDDI